MKKLGLLLIGVLTLFACEQEELDNFVNSDVNQVQTRAASSIADFNPIVELEDVLINILNVGNTSNKYLSCESSGSKMMLCPNDEGNGRQRWYLRYGRITSAGGNNNVNENTYGIVCPDKYMSPDVPTYAYLSFCPKNIFSPSTMGLTVSSLNDDKYTLGFISMGAFPLTIYYLQSQKTTGDSMDFTTSNKMTNLSQWQIVPVGEYELVDIQYVRTTVDNFEPTEMVCDHDEYTNESLSVDTWNYSFSITYTEKSNFSKMEGTSVSVSQGLSVGLPNVLGQNSSIGFNSSIQQQTNRSWTYGTEDKKDITKTRTAQIPVKPGETVRLEAYMTMYKGSMTYVATLRRIGDFKTFRVKGKWTGECFSSFNARTYRAKTGALLNEYTLK